MVCFSGCISVTSLLSFLELYIITCIFLNQSEQCERFSIL
ncbi:hypothetical protein GYH30_038671 [Glycine max]|nr:hypothetical protein GYH30_038671 [Glycine max]